MYHPSPERPSSCIQGMAPAFEGVSQTLRMSRLAKLSALTRILISSQCPPVIQGPGHSSNKAWLFAAAWCVPCIWHAMRTACQQQLMPCRVIDHPALIVQEIMKKAAVPVSVRQAFAALHPLQAHQLLSLDLPFATTTVCRVITSPVTPPNAHHLRPDQDISSRRTAKAHAHTHTPGLHLACRWHSPEVVPAHPHPHLAHKPKGRPNMEKREDASPRIAATRGPQEALQQQPAQAGQSHHHKTSAGQAPALLSRVCSPMTACGMTDDMKWPSVHIVLTFLLRLPLHVLTLQLLVPRV